MPDKDYYSFDEVLSDLSMEEDELKRLVSAGEIRAFRDQDTMRFKAADIERLKTDTEAPAGDEIDLELDDDLDLGSELDLGAADSGDELILDDEPSEEPEMVNLGSRARTARGGKRSAAGAPQRSTPRSQAAAAAEEGSESPALLLALVVGFILLVFANFAALGAVSGQTNALTGFLADMFAS